jgi:AraC-like DNA-binding protein
MKTRNSENILFFSPSDMHYMQVVYGINVTNEFPRHVHHKFCVGIVEQGDRAILQAGRSIVVPENALFIINPGVAHACKSKTKGGHSYLVVCVEMEKMQQLASQISGKAQPLPIIKDVVLFDSELISKIRYLFRILKGGNPSLQREAVFTSLLSRLIILYGDTPPAPCQMGMQHRGISRARGYIEAYFMQNPSLEELSRVASLSPFHFHRLFLRNIGVSPHQYLIQFRIRKARELLLEGNSIARVALDLGFADQSHFTRFFKRIIGVAPGRFIQLHKKQVL